jgi:hypothetical protein
MEEHTQHKTTCGVQAAIRTVKRESFAERKPISPSRLNLTIIIFQRVTKFFLYLYLLTSNLAQRHARNFNIGIYTCHHDPLHSHE